MQPLRVESKLKRRSNVWLSCKCSFDDSLMYFFHFLCQVFQICYAKAAVSGESSQHDVEEFLQTAGGWEGLTIGVKEECKGHLGSCYSFNCETKALHEITWGSNHVCDQQNTFLSKQDVLITNNTMGAEFLGEGDLICLPLPRAVKTPTALWLLFPEIKTTLESESNQQSDQLFFFFEEMPIRFWKKQLKLPADVCRSHHCLHLCTQSIRDPIGEKINHSCIDSLASSWKLNALMRK